MAESSTSPPPVAGGGGGATTSPAVRTTPPGKKRCLLTLSVLLSFLAGLPFLLSSTAIYRSALPPLLSLPVRPLSSPTRLHALFVRSQLPEPSLSSRLHLSLSSKLQHLTAASLAAPSCLVPNYTLSVAVDSVSNFPDLDLGGEDDAIDEVLESVLQGGQEGHGRMYTVVVVDVDREGGVRVVVGKHRHAWVIGKIDEEEVAGIVGRIFVEVFLKGGVEGRDGDGGGETMPVGLDGSVVLSFSLLHADPADGVYGW